MPVNFCENVFPFSVEFTSFNIIETYLSYVNSITSEQRIKLRYVAIKGHKLLNVNQILLITLGNINPFRLANADFLSEKLLLYCYY